MTWPEAFAIVGTVASVAGMLVGLMYFGSRYTDEGDGED